MQNNLTTNKNPLAINGFRMVFNRAPNTSYFCQNFILPSIINNEMLVARPRIDAYYPGDKVVFDELTVTMLVTEDLENYIEIYDWLLAQDNSTDDLTIHMLTSKNNMNRTVRFVNAFPTNIGSISFSVQESDITYAQVDVTFRYDYFTFSNSQNKLIAHP